MANQTPAERGAREVPQLEDLGLGSGVSAFRPGRALRRSDLPPHPLQPTVKQNEDESNPDSTEHGEEEQSEANNQTSADSEAVRRLEAELAQERARSLALERTSAGISTNDVLAVDRHVKEPKGLDITPWDGDPATLRPFITDILVEFSMRPRTYHNEDIRTKSIYGWLKNGSTPKLWAQGYISGELEPPFSTAAGFIDAIKAHFENLTTFITSFGAFKYLVLPFGLTNGPASFQHYINDVLFEYLHDFCQAYLDDILIYSKTLKEHKQHVRAVLQRLRDTGLQIDIHKCEFHVQETTFLDLLISTEGLRMDPSKMHVIQD
jgi:Reverse transcriptase (RNA-dependent DNA polymerase)